MEQHFMDGMQMRFYKFIMKYPGYLSILIFLCPSPGQSQLCDSLPPGFQQPAVRCLFYDVDDSVLYAGGGFWTLANGQSVNKIAKWQNNQWDSLGSGVNDGGQVLSIVKFNDTIYAAGTFNQIGGITSKGLAKWNGSNWQHVGDFSTDAGYGSVWRLLVHDNNLYIGGGFTKLNGSPANAIVRYDGLNFYTYPVIDPVSTVITSIAFYNNELYVGGNFHPGAGRQDITKFDGTSWVSVGGGLSGGATVVDDMLVYNGELIISGHFLSLYGDPGDLIAKWDGSLWTSLGAGLVGGNCYDMFIFNNELFVGGNLSHAGGNTIENIAKWNGTNWSNTGITLNSGVAAFEAKNSSELFIGGAFTLAGNDTMKRITKYNLPTGLNDPVSNDFEIYPNPVSSLLHINDNNNIIQHCEVYNMLNQLVLTIKENPVLDLSCLENGIYNFRFYLKDNNILSRKVVKF